MWEYFIFGMTMLPYLYFINIYAAAAAAVTVNNTNKRNNTLVV